MEMPRTREESGVFREDIRSPLAASCTQPYNRPFQWCISYIQPRSGKPAIHIIVVLPYTGDCLEFLRWAIRVFEKSSRYPFTSIE